MQTRRSPGPWLWPLGLAVVGVLLLLDNFLLLGDFNAFLLWPLVLVVVGAQILLKGDFLPHNTGQTFGITRGSVETATLEISAGAIDVQIRALQREGRLIAGQYAAQSRPQMQVDGLRAFLKLDRAATPWVSFSDWAMGLAVDLPWQILISTHVGQVNLDLSHVIVESTAISTGIGDIRFVCPAEVLGEIHLRSTLGNIQFITPEGVNTHIMVNGSRFLGIHADENRYTQPEPGVFEPHDVDPTLPFINIYLSGTFGDIYLA
ncbi:MAG: hypothetical protein K8L99_17975 [Anaerolineae bacterium]|nr:hypothetical protein [Anaerolineae bacterium]